MDLASLNIQRGRDHGVNWCRARKALGLSVPNTFEEARTLGLFSDENLAILKATYEWVYFVGLCFFLLYEFVNVVIVVWSRLQTNVEKALCSTLHCYLNGYSASTRYRLCIKANKYWNELIKLTRNVLLMLPLKSRVSVCQNTYITDIRFSFVKVLCW